MTDILPPRPPKQLRSRRTLDRIVRAAMEIVAEEGEAGLTVHRVVTRAGASVGSFYARFTGKEDLLRFLHEQVGRDAAARWNQVVSEKDLGALPLPELVEAVVELLGEALDPGPHHPIESGSAAKRRGGASRAFRGHVFATLEKVLLGRADEMKHPEPAVAVRLGLGAVAGLLEGDEDGGEEGAQEGTGAVPPERRRAEAVRLLLGYLAGGTEGTSGAGRVDFFDVWS